MPEKQKFSFEENLPEKYLHQGNQTIPSENMRGMIEKIRGTLLEKIKKIFELLPLKIDETNKENLFRRRTAEQILESGFITGCTDSGLVFICLARACGIPAKYIEAINKKWLESGGEESGHIYSQIYDELNKKWIWIDPEFKKINSSPSENDRIVFKEGLDSWDIGIRDYQSLKDTFSKFRKKWLEQKNKSS